MVENSILRERARRQLGGGIFKPSWLKLLGALVILGVIEGALGFTGFGIIISMLITGPCMYATERICAKCAKNQGEVDYNSLFVGFSENFTQTFLLGLLTTIFIFLWSLLLIIPGIIKSYSYGMSYFIQQEQDKKDWKYCFEESKRIMHGHKQQLFFLDLSFIGWYLLGAICLGVGVLFVMPYHQLARSNFFLELYYAEKSTQEEQPQETAVLENKEENEQTTTQDSSQDNPQDDGAEDDLFN